MQQWGETRSALVTSWCPSAFGSIARFRHRRPYMIFKGGASDAPARRLASAGPSCSEAHLFGMVATNAGRYGERRWSVGALQVAESSRSEKRRGRNSRAVGALQVAEFESVREEEVKRKKVVQGKGVEEEEGQERKKEKKEQMKQQARRSRGSFKFAVSSRSSGR